ncbi:MAG TPA: hypothetical protein VF625_13210 [Longimicrobium sp.]|jgi:hypothetical protein
MIRGTALLAASLLVLAGCGDDSTGSSDGALGTVSFNYSGDASGSFSASSRNEDPNIRPPVSGGEVAIGTRSDDAAFGVQVTGIEPSGGGSRATIGDLVGISVPVSSGAATFRISPTCLDDDCPFVFVALDTDITGDEPDLLGTFWFMEEGTVRVTSTSNDRVRGTFSGTAISFDLETGEDFGTMEIRNGEFDVPVYTVSGEFNRTPKDARISAARARMNASR